MAKRKPAEQREGTIDELVIPNNTEPQTPDDLMREALKNAVTACEKTFAGYDIQYAIHFEVRQVYMDEHLGPGHIYDTLAEYAQKLKRKP